MNVSTLPLAGLHLVEPARHRDARGYFCETYNARAYAAAGIDIAFVQDNEALSRRSGTVRGLHFQAPPFAQAKLVRAVRGRILDVAVDIRKDSPTFGRHVAIELSAANGRLLLIAAGFAHGYVTLEPNTTVAYKVSNYYSAAHEAGVAWDDPALGIGWGIDARDAILSEKDRGHPSLAAIETPFQFDPADKT